MQKSFMKIKEACEFFSLGKDVFYKAIHNGELKAYKPNCRGFLLLDHDKVRRTSPNGLSILF